MRDLRANQRMAVLGDQQELRPQQGRDIRETFRQPDYHIMLVANEFQTGFDRNAVVGL